VARAFLRFRGEILMNIKALKQAKADNERDQAKLRAEARGIMATAAERD
jgi:hypothetical protein